MFTESKALKSQRKNGVADIDGSYRLEIVAALARNLALAGLFLNFRRLLSQVAVGKMLGSITR